MQPHGEVEDGAAHSDSEQNEIEIIDVDEPEMVENGDSQVQNEEDEKVAPEDPLRNVPSKTGRPRPGPKSRTQHPKGKKAERKSRRVSSDEVEERSRSVSSSAERKSRAARKAPIEEVEEDGEEQRQSPKQVGTVAERRSRASRKAPEDEENGEEQDSPKQAAGGTDRVLRPSRKVPVEDTAEEDGEEKEAHKQVASHPERKLRACRKLPSDPVAEVEEQEPTREVYRERSLSSEPSQSCFQPSVMILRLPEEGLREGTPSEEPPSVQPPSVQPPSEQPPSEQPPSEDPPSEPLAEEDDMDTLAISESSVEEFSHSSCWADRLEEGLEAMESKRSHSMTPCLPEVDEADSRRTLWRPEGDVSFCSTLRSMSGRRSLNRDRSNPPPLTFQRRKVSPDDDGSAPTAGRYTSRQESVHKAEPQQSSKRPLEDTNPSPLDHGMPHKRRRTSPGFLSALRDRFGAGTVLNGLSQEARQDNPPKKWCSVM